MNAGPTQSLSDFFKPSATGENKNGMRWNLKRVTVFLGEVLQLRIRRDILKFIGLDIKTKGEIESNFKLNESVSEVHLSLLEKAMLILRTLTQKQAEKANKNTPSMHKPA